MRGLLLSHELSPFFEQNPVLFVLVVLLGACLQLPVSRPTSVPSAQAFCTPPQSHGGVNAAKVKYDLLFMLIYLKSVSRKMQSSASATGEPGRLLSVLNLFIHGSSLSLR